MSNEMKEGAVVVLSGGQDSTTCLHWAIREYGRENVRAICFNYGQRHITETILARKIADRAQVPFEIIALGHDILQGTSPLTNRNEKVEQYADADSLPGGLENTFVPSRNLVFLTIASNRAYVHRLRHIVTGVCEEDFGGYPDCRQVFIDKLQAATNAALFLEEDFGEDHLIKITTPLMHLSKKATVELAQELGDECMEAISFTHTCYNGKDFTRGENGNVVLGCGSCHSCLLRKRGFDEAGIDDPARARYQWVVEGGSDSEFVSPEDC
ncbi:7-cyano-7-deazaguanine synthase [Vibrio phage vB_VcorM_GR7B]|nr:7-cyano-7-deazaguanine synthase [Vibrio phage vB_VcorM_GR7B]